jgi:hypothetical protein
MNRTGIFAREAKGVVSDRHICCRRTFVPASPLPIPSLRENCSCASVRRIDRRLPTIALTKTTHVIIFAKLNRSLQLCGGGTNSGEDLHHTSFLLHCWMLDLKTARPRRLTKVRSVATCVRLSWGSDAESRYFSFSRYSWLLSHPCFLPSFSPC